MRKEPLAGDDVFLIHGFLTPAECADLVARTEAIGYGPAPLTTAAGPVMASEVRNNDRVMVDDPARAAALWDRARGFFPPRDGCPAVGLNERFRFYRYDPGERFRPHTDGYFARTGARSKLTFMIYLSGECDGGETIIYIDADDGLPLPDGTELRVPPEPGKVLAFRHDLLHEGAAVRAGRKYVLRSDVMYLDPPPEGAHA